MRLPSGWSRCISICPSRWADGRLLPGGPCLGSAWRVIRWITPPSPPEFVLGPSGRAPGPGGGDQARGSRGGAGSPPVALQRGERAAVTEAPSQARSAGRCGETCPRCAVCMRVDMCTRARCCVLFCSEPGPGPPWGHRVRQRPSGGLHRRGHRGCGGAKVTQTGTRARLPGAPGAGAHDRARRTERV